LPNKELKDKFSHLNNIVNELRDLGFDVPEVDISHKFLRALPPKYLDDCHIVGEIKLEDYHSFRSLG
jgi:hypothetical protein